MDKKWIIFNQDWKSFCERGLNNVGTIVSTTHGKFLIGDMSSNAGICGHCRMFHDNTIIVYYKVVYKKEDS